ncbi:MAG: SH3 domain-containing protein [Bacteroidetes bacterium]|nr:MAG: SH3 domain-containing protein [Bacteroidota bacterium]
MLLVLLFAACEPNQEGEGGVSTPGFEDLLQGFQSVSQEAQELARPNKVEAWVDKLAVKAQPGEDMPTIARLKEGEVVEYLYQRTIRKSTFTLRGQEYSQPWILVKLPDGQMGWVHEGGVRYVQPELTDLFSTGADDPNNPYTRARSLNAPAQPAAPAGPNWTIVPGKSAGNIRLNTSEAELIKLYGSPNVTRGNVQVSQSQTKDCTILFPNTQDEMRITWKDDSRSKVEAVYLTKPNAHWHLNTGVKVGMSLLDLTKANKSPLSFYGFNWEYSGTVSSWRNGVLRKYDKFFYVVLVPVGASKADLAQFQGNKVFSSNTKGVDKLNLHVGKIVIYLD